VVAFGTWKLECSGGNVEQKRLDVTVKIIRLKRISGLPGTAKTHGVAYI